LTGVGGGFLLHRFFTASLRRRRLQKLP
jgi:hypothetical protein